MKKLILSAAIMIAFVTYSFAGNNSRLTFAGADHFKSHFANASDISVRTIGEYTEVNFTWNEEKIQAFYDNDGNLAVTSRTVSFNHLPLATQQALKKQYSDYTVTETIEFDNANEGLSFYVGLEKAGKKMIVNVSLSGDITEFKKTK